MSLTLGREGGIAKPLKKRTVGQTNIAHVYDGANHIWPTSVIHFSDFTSVQLRYIWGSDDGRDLDTKSYYVNSPINNLNYVAVGWSWNLSQIPYLYWGGDNTDSGAECVMFNIESMIDLEDKMPDIMKMNLCANWFGSLSRGHVTVECTAYKGGVIVHAWQLKNHEIDVDNRGMFIFPLADGTINMPDGHGGYIHSDGYCWYENQPKDKYKVWNNQVNTTGTPLTLDKPTLNITSDDNYSYEYHTVLLNEDNTVYNNSYTDDYKFRFGFVAGNSEFRGQQTIQCYVGTQGGKADDGKTSIGEIKYTKLNKIGELTIYSPIES